ncbi:MAG: sigma-70 family RNA polymerase sigma factor, partial [Wenzhouxiangellaceae bacterium]|nr:sigma-70 family RNA polymerase sigma factor [Wenzhouxiangellaceae bacterium]
MSDARSDNDLVLAWARGDARAFDTLYERYRGPLYRYLFHGLGDRALADDAYQDTWSSIVEARDRFEPRTEFRRWAFRIAHNRLVDHWRRTGRRPQESDAGLDELPHASVPDAEAERDEDARRLRRALQQLPAEQREAFLLQQEAGLTLADIAARDGVGRE